MINYVLDMFTPEGFKFIFDDGTYTLIDLVNDYPRYRAPNGYINDKKWHYTVKEVDLIYDKYNKNKNKNKYKIGDVLYLEKKSQYKYFSNEGISFKKSTQSELDCYEYKKGFNTDNAKVYLLITKLFSKKIRETSL